MSVLDTKSLVNLPRQMADKMITKTLSTSTVAKLSGAEPMKFGNVNIIRFNDGVRAQFVEENGAKASTSAAWETVTATPHKAQVTIRTSDEFIWASEDYQLGVLDQLVDAASVALSRALDLGLYHRINPHTGNAITTWTNYLTATKNVVEAGTNEADADIRAAVGKVIDTGVPVTGLALDPKMAYALANLQGLSAGKPNGMPRYPELGLGTDVSGFLGLDAAVGTTVSGTPEAADTLVRAIAGDFKDGIRWGIQRELPLEVIPYGDPDDTGVDLKAHNQVALRLEIVYGWYVLEDRFAIVKAKTAAAGR